MIITVTGYKGGIGKTTTALHLAAYLQRQAPAVLVDGDLNRSATGWGRNGTLPFRVVDERQAAKVSREFEHIVIDTAARPVREDLEALVAGCDHLIIPTTPDALALIPRRSGFDRLPGPTVKRGRPESEPVKFTATRY